jgi:hypothetical protein
MLFRDIFGIYREDHMEHISTLCGKKSKFLTVAAGGTIWLPLGFKWLRSFVMLSVLVRKMLSDFQFEFGESRSQDS